MDGTVVRSTVAPKLPGKGYTVTLGGVPARFESAPDRCDVCRRPLRTPRGRPACDSIFWGSPLRRRVQAIHGCIRNCRWTPDAGMNPSFSRMLQIRSARLEKV